MRHKLETQNASSTLKQWYYGYNSPARAKTKGKKMNAVQHYRTNQLADSYQRKLDIKTNALIGSALRTVISAKTIEEKHIALECLLGVIISGQQYQDTTTYQ